AAGAVFSGVVLVTGLYSFIQVPIYEATETVEAETQARRPLAGPDVSGLGASGFGWSAEERFYSTQIEIIRSPDLAQRVINRLGLRDEPIFEGVSDPAGALSRLVQPELRRDTGIIEISMNGADPRRAAELAN